MQTINEIIPYAPVIFGSILVAGVAYILLMFFMRVDLADFDIDVDIDADASADIDVDGSE